MSATDTGTASLLAVLHANEMALTEAQSENWPAVVSACEEVEATVIELLVDLDDDLDLAIHERIYGFGDGRSDAQFVLDYFGYKG